VTSLDLEDIQGTVLRGYRVDHARHFVLSVVDPAGARDLLAALMSGSSSLPQITTAAPWTTKPRTFLNVGITYQGLASLGVPADALNSFPASFRLGATAPATAAKVGDVGPSDPSNWVNGLADGASVHILLSLWVHQGRDVLEDASAQLRAAFGSALKELGAMDADALPDNKVHFGYTDNISQPTVDGAPPTKRPRPDCQPLAPAGEFLMGHPSQNVGGAPYSVSPVELSTNSSFGAFRLLEQDVAGFERFLGAGAAQIGVDKELLAAKVCGRWRNGVPLVLSPDTATPSPPIPPEDINNYNYVPADNPLGGDYLGYACPVGAHMRRTNPRNEDVASEAGSLHRITRRAMPYGPAYDPARPDDKPRGLVGWFINVDLSNQFEFLMQNWVNDSHFVKSARDPANPKVNPVFNISGQDVILGVNQDPSSTSFTVSFPPTGTSPAVNKQVTGFGSFVTTRGGAYCYLPSMTALRYLVALS
jgi:deferrochelatase/peroxidase EfeB